MTEQSVQSGAIDRETRHSAEKSRCPFPQKKCIPCKFLDIICKADWAVSKSGLAQLTHAYLRSRVEGLIFSSLLYWEERIAGFFMYFLQWNCMYYPPNNTSATMGLDARE